MPVLSIIEVSGLYSTIVINPSPNFCFLFLLFFSLPSKDFIIITWYIKNYFISRWTPTNEGCASIAPKPQECRWNTVMTETDWFSIDLLQILGLIQNVKTHKNRKKKKIQSKKVNFPIRLYQSFENLYQATPIFFKLMETPRENA